MAADEPTTEEPFMNEQQRDYFRGKLLAWKDDILKEAKDTLQFLQEADRNQPDVVDRASSETERAIELRARQQVPITMIVLANTMATAHGNFTA